MTDLTFWALAPVIMTTFEVSSIRLIPGFLPPSAAINVAEPISAPPPSWR